MVANKTGRIDSNTIQNGDVPSSAKLIDLQELLNQNSASAASKKNQEEAGGDTSVMRVLLKLNGDLDGQAQ